MNTSYDKRTKTLIIAAVASLFVFLMLILGVYLFQKRDVAPGDGDAAVEPVVTEWRADDIWKQKPVQKETFEIPENFEEGTVKIETQWGWSAGRESCIIQMNESHQISIPGLNETIEMEDLGNGTEQADCTAEINALKALGYTNAEIGAFNLPHADETKNNTWFPSNPEVVTGEWDSSKGPLVIDINFTGLDGPPDEWCHSTTGTTKDDPICNGSHMYRVRVTWNAVEDTPTPTPTNTPSLTPTPTPTPEPEKANLGDFVWRDNNKNGIQDDGEPGIEGITVKLYTETGTEPLETQQTDELGNYSFRNIDAGNYIVEFGDFPSYARSGANLGSNNEKDSDANIETGKTEVITLTAGQTDNSWDAGYYMQVGKIGDCVWEDVNKDGIQDDSETTGVPGVTVGLYTDASANTALDTDTTDNDGCYLFEDVEAGSYVVKFTLPTGYAYSPAGTGSDTCKDSDANVTTGYTGNITLDAGETDLCWDAGMYRLNPQIQIIKSEIADHDNATDFQIIASGGDATFHITVTNTGEIDLKDVVVTDAMAPGCARNISTIDLADSTPVGVLKVDQSVTYSCQDTNVTESYTNVAEVVGTPIDGRSPVEDEDDSEVVLAGTPAIRVQKSEVENHSVAQDTQTVEKGGTATFYIKVTNIGAVALENVNVTDPLALSCARYLTEDDGTSETLQVSLAIGESKSFTCTQTSVNSGFVNVVTVTAKSVDTDEVVTDDDPTTVVVPGNVTVTKTSAPTCEADTSATVVYTVTVANPTSDSRVLEITDILDEKVDGDMLNVSSITSGGVYNADLNQIVWANTSMTANETKTFTYSVTVQNADFGTYVNTVIVKQDGIEVGRAVHTVNVMCLPATGILGDDTNRIIFPVIAIIAGITFFALGGHIYVGNLISKRKTNGGILTD